jgi:hypothetical protein
MKKYLFLAFIALFCMFSHSAWADTAYVKLTAENGTVSWIEISGYINGKNIEISGYAIDNTAEGSIDLNEVWSQSGGNGDHYQVTSIGDYAFCECSGLTSIEIASSVDYIANNAFYWCDGLTSITIPSSVTCIGNGAFLGCTNLTSIVVESGNSVYDSRNNCNAIIEKSTNKLIAGCMYTKIPSNVTSIENYAFFYCEYLAEVDLPSTLTSIGISSFEGCRGLTSISIPSSVTSIGEGAFSSCSGLTSIIIPSSVTSIGEGAFYLCSGLTSIVVESGNTVYDSRNNSNAIIETASNTLIAGGRNTKIPSSVTCIGDNAFFLCTELTSIEIPSSVTCIGNDAFSQCTGLTSIDLPNSITSIGDGAFYSCSSLTSITSYITDVFKTENNAFRGCDNATLYVPKGLVDTYKSTADWSSFSNIVEMSNNQYDVNNDGSVDISDVVALVNAILSSSTTDNSFDVNGDGSVDISDVVSLVNTILNGTGTGSDDNSQAYLTCPDDNHPHMIDLGLPSGTKWACCNVGASSPEEYGGYYAWGETTEKDVYDWNTYTYCDGSESTCHDLGNDIAGTQYDVAYVKWGGSWVMPSKEQQDELLNNCTYTWTTKNGINGGEFTGPNGGTIFLPAAGSRWKENLSLAVVLGTYWSSTQYPSYSSTAYNLYFGSPSVSLDNPGRVYGFTVRPVVKK